MSMDSFCGDRYLAGGEWQLWGPSRARCDRIGGITALWREADDRPSIARSTLSRLGEANHVSPPSGGGTESSNPVPSSSESVSAVNRRALPEEPRGFAALGLCTGPEKGPARRTRRHFALFL